MQTQNVARFLSISVNQYGTMLACNDGGHATCLLAKANVKLLATLLANIYLALACYIAMLTDLTLACSTLFSVAV